MKIGFILCVLFFGAGYSLFLFYGPKASITHAPVLNSVSIKAAASKSTPVPSKILNSGEAEVSGEQKKKDFIEMAQRILRELPTREDLKSLSPQEVHRSPQILMDAGLALGQVAERLDQNSELIHEALGFYQDCAGNAELPSSVRALCFSNLESRSKAAGIEIPWDDLVSENIRKLAKKL